MTRFSFILLRVLFDSEARHNFNTHVFLYKKKLNFVDDKAAKHVVNKRRAVNVRPNEHVE